MIASHISSRCCQQLLRSAGKSHKASFVSLGSRPDSDDHKHKPPAKTIDGNEDSISRADTAYGKKRKSFAEQYRAQQKSTGVDKVLETLFSSNRSRDNASPLSRYSRTPKIQESSEPTWSETSIDRRLSVLHNQLVKGTSGLEYIWSSCQQLLEDNDKEENRSAHIATVKRRDVAFRDILLAIVAKQRISVQGEIVTPAKVIEVYREHYVMRYWWHEVLWLQLAKVIHLIYANKATNSGYAEGPRYSKADVDPLLRELLAVWALFLQRYRSPDFLVKANGVFPETLDGILDVHKTSGDHIQARLADQFSIKLPKHTNNRHIAVMAAAATATVDILETTAATSPFLYDNLLKDLRQGVLDVQTAKTRLLAAGVESSIIDEYLKNSQSTPYYVEQQPQIIEDDVRQPRQSKPGQERQELDWHDANLQSRLADIDGASNRSDAQGAIVLWQEFQRYFQAEKPLTPENKDKLTVRFLRTFWALRRSDKAVAVWNDIVNSGQNPGQIHWTAMLVGCIRARDPGSLQEIWSNMQRSQVKPDINTWTTYINGLIKLHKWQAGLSALQTLGRTWKGPSAIRMPNAKDIPQNTNTNKNNPDTLTPTIAPVNGALSALIDIKKPELASTVLTWALSQDLPLETYTFNILLRPIVRAGSSAKIQFHLSEMSAHNCSPDIATFTIILNGLVSNKTSHFHTLSPQAQEHRIISILKDMEAHSIPANGHTYTTLLDGLLSSTKYRNPSTTVIEANVPAARTVLSHMQSRSIHPSSHIYTILITHYFSLSPPNLAAIDSLWANLETSHQTSKLDSIFYDRMIENYANLGEIEQALKFLRRLPQEGKSPGWWALFRMLAALERVGEWDLCRELVGDVEVEGEDGRMDGVGDGEGERGRGLLRHGQGTWRGKKDFYELVEELRERGVLDVEGTELR